MNESKPKVLVVDDEPAIRRFLRLALTPHYDVIEASSGAEALTVASEKKPDLVILDLGLPDMDGIQVTRALREWTQVPVLILSVKGSEGDKIAALDAGADDYLTKPFGAGELMARLRAALRRSAHEKSDPVFSCGVLMVDMPRRIVTVAGREVQLTPNEYDILRQLVINCGKVLTHRHLLREVWGPSYDREFHMLHVNISNLRHKIEEDPSRPQFVITEPGVGYRLKTN